MSAMTEAAMQLGSAPFANFSFKSSRTSWTILVLFSDANRPSAAIALNLGASRIMGTKSPCVFEAPRTLSFN